MNTLELDRDHCGARFEKLHGEFSDQALIDFCRAVVWRHGADFEWPPR